MNYTIYRGTTPGNVLPITTVTNMSNPLHGVATWNDTTAVAGTRYYYKVRGINNGLASNWSNEAAVIAGAPTEPRNLAAVVKDGSVTLSWASPLHDGGSPVIRYAIYRGTSPGDETYYNTTTSTMHFKDTNVTANRTYYYTVAAANAVGEGLGSAEVTITIPATTPSSLAPELVAGIAIAGSIGGVVFVVAIAKHRPRKVRR